jgi:hypothetical protein
MVEMRKVMSIDAETNGLWGNPFAIAAILYDEKGKELDKICLRLPNLFVTNDWVKLNVLPTLNNFEVTHSVYEEMLKDFAVFYKKYKSQCQVLWHMGHIVEAHLFRELHRLGLIGDWDAPYVPIEVSAYLEQVGEPADSVDNYAKEHGIEIKDYGSTHNPLYDCEVAYKVYKNVVMTVVHTDTE